jgi:Lrp/AsnC family transcriptional regulator for asnA, asnC and gidA
VRVGPGLRGLDVGVGSTPWELFFPMGMRAGGGRCRHWSGKKLRYQVTLYMVDYENRSCATIIEEYLYKICVTPLCMKGVADELDWKILTMLKENSRTTNVALARELGVSEGMVRQRIARMKEDGTILRFTIETASRGVKAIIMVNIEMNVHTAKIAARIRALGGVDKVYETSGESDIVALVDVEDTDTLNGVVEAIRVMGQITNTTTKLVMGEL